MMKPTEADRLPTDHRNNFDLLRLIAAVQVAFMHSSQHLHVLTDGWGQIVRTVVSFFEGVPIFFVISGYLVSQSYQRSPALRGYARRRFLRIYPGLWACFTVSLVLVSSLGFITAKAARSLEFPAWLVGQLTIGQFYNPGFLRGFGVGSLNGSLWTIPVELAFYAFLPLIYLVGLNRLSPRAGGWLLILLAAGSVAVRCALPDMDSTAPLLRKILGVTLLPHLYLFLLGMLLQRHWDRLHGAFMGKLWIWLILFLGLMCADAFLFDRMSARHPLIKSIGTLILGCVAVSFAFSFRNLSQILLRGNDLSYGVYLYHMLVVNTLLHEGFAGRPVLLWAALGMTGVLAWASWKLVEQRMLRLKATGVRPPRETADPGSLPA